MSVDYVDKVADVCTQFLKDLLLKKCPKDIHPRLWSSVLQDSVKKRYEAALHELELLQEDLESYPINYNPSYIHNITKTKIKRYEASLSNSIEGATEHKHLEGCMSTHTSASIDIAAVINRLFRSTDHNMDKHSCEDALDCLFSIYKVAQKTFIANITTQVIERHIVRGIERIFSPVVVNGLTDSEAGAIAMEPAAARRQRKFLEERIAKLGDGHAVLKGVMRSI